MNDSQRIAHDIGAAVKSSRRTVAAAESLTAGNIATTLASAGDASEWFSASRPPGTVIICAGTTADLQVFEHSFEGPPEQIVALATRHALLHLRDAATTIRPATP